MSNATDPEKAAEIFVRKLRNVGQPGSRQDWKVVLAHLIILPSVTIEAVARAARMAGLGWLVPVAEGLLEEERAGRAFRDTDGALTLRERPRAAGLVDLL